MAKSWLVDCKGIAKKVRHASLPSGVQIKDCGAKRECPKCHHWIDNSDVSYEWPGLPAGVKFDPSDSQLLEHLAAKCGAGEAKSHAFIDEFIPTLEMDKGICYTHPQDLPGATKDGTSIHFFHKTSNAYASGQRKRRKIHNDQNQENVRWHKTGKTKPVCDNGVQKGCKKIMVLYKSSEKGSKPVKSNWVMHQYHLGSEDDEKDDAFVVSKIFYQQSKQTETEDNGVAATDDSNAVLNPYCPKTPKIVTPYLPRGSSAHCDDALDDIMLTAAEDTTCAKIESCFTPSTSYMGDVELPECLAGESQAQDPGVNDIDDPLLCKEIFSSCAPLDDTMSLNDLDDYCQSYGISNFDTELQFTELPFGSQDSVLNWLDKP
uniref:NAC domain-containing protein n=1 Tax=Chenopodium quinoa TaxID=63459 RepID=A0A803M386_CHEQI